MSKESSPSQPRSFYESVRLFRSFFLERENGDTIPMREVENFSQTEGLTFGCEPNGGGLRNHEAHLNFQIRQGGLEIVKENEIEFIRIIDKDKIL